MAKCACVRACRQEAWQKCVRACVWCAVVVVRCGSRGIIGGEEGVEGGVGKGRERE